MTIWEYFKWWDLSLEEINTQMHDVANNALDKRENNKTR